MQRSTHPIDRPLTRRAVLGGLAAAGAAGVVGCTSPTAPKSGGKSKQLSLLLLGPTQDLLRYVNKTVIPTFTKASGYDVQVQSSDWGSAFQKVTTAAASNSLADVLLIGGIWTAPLAAKNVLLDLSDRVNSWSDADQFYPGMIADGKWQDKQYAVPFGGDVRSGMYRTDLLHRAGVTDLPDTWDEWSSVAKKVKATGAVKAPIDWGLDKSIGLQQAFAQLFLEAGGSYFDDNGKAQFNSEAGVKALTFLTDTYRRGLADVNMVDSGNGPSSLSRGETAMSLRGFSAQINATQYAPKVVTKLAAGPALRPTAEAKSKAVAWINKFAIAANTKDPDGAWKLLTHLVSKDTLSRFTQLNAALPARKDLADASWITSLGRQILRTAPTAISQPPNPKMLQIGPAVTTLLEPAIRGSASVSKTLAAIDAKVDSFDG